MNEQLFHKLQLENTIHSKRFELLQHYLYLYGSRLKGEPNLFEKFHNDEIKPDSEAGLAYMESLMEIERLECQIDFMKGKLDFLTEK